jgi:hypothetical protein
MIAAAPPAPRGAIVIRAAPPEAKASPTPKAAAAAKSATDTAATAPAAAKSATDTAATTPAAAPRFSRCGTGACHEASHTYGTQNVKQSQQRSRHPARERFPLTRFRHDDLTDLTSVFRRISIGLETGSNNALGE